MSIARRYPHGAEFPAEAFVQVALERYFEHLGFVTNNDGHVDLLCNHPTTKERWHIEAKGHTSAPGLDFRTCLGQLVQRMHDRETRYGIALPDIPQYTSQIAATSHWVIEVLRIHWFLVAQDGSLRVVPPAHIGARDA